MKAQIKGQIKISDYSAKMGLKRKYPPESLTAAEGCEFDNCFSCAGINCQIRGEKRYCRYANLGNPYPCTAIEIIENNRGKPNKHCQFIDQSLAYHRAGDHQPVPCCMMCGDRCGSQCGRAKESRETEI